MRRALQVWPAIDLYGGRCVRLVQGDFLRETVFSTDPVAVAAEWKRRGARRLHIVDLNGARDGVAAHAAVVQQIVQQVGLAVQLGGGIRDEAVIRHWLDVGVARLVVGTRAVQDPDWVVAMGHRFPGQLVLGLDARQGQVAIQGWQNNTHVTVVDLLERVAGAPLAAVVYTDIARDGTLGGPNLEAIRQVCQATRLPVVASGGIATIDDVRQLASLPVEGCIIGRAFYEGTLRWEELRQLGDLVE